MPTSLIGNGSGSFPTTARLPTTTGFCRGASTAGGCRSGRWTDAKRSRSSAVNARSSCLPRAQGETDLVYRNGAFYLLAVCVVDEPTPQEVDGVLGVDLGVTNIAVDSDATMHSGAHIKHVRYRHRRLRRKLQRKNTRAARLRLRRLSGQERRFATDTNHVDLQTSRTTGRMHETSSGA